MNSPENPQSQQEQSPASDLFDVNEDLKPVVDDLRMYADLLNLSSGSEMELPSISIQILAGKLFELTFALESIHQKIKKLLKH